MEYNKLGRTGLTVSSLCLGTMSFGRWIDESASVAIMNQAIDSGVNFIDTANFYGKGQDADHPYGTGVSEEIIGRALKGRRDKVVLATKVGLAMGHNHNDAGLSRGHIIQEAEASLKRLQTDYIDLYQVHRFDPDTPLEETLRALDDLVRQGKVRYIGCSNFAAWQIAKSHGISERMNLEKFASVQPQYNMLVRDIEKELLPFCQSENLGVLVYSPMGRGMLSGKYRSPEDTPVESRAAHGERMLNTLFSPRNFSLIDQLRPLAEEAGMPLAQLALAWVLANPVITSAIMGITKLKHVTEAIEASNINLTTDLLKAVDDTYNRIDEPQ